MKWLASILLLLAPLAYAKPHPKLRTALNLAHFGLAVGDVAKTQSNLRMPGGRELDPLAITNPTGMYAEAMAGVAVAWYASYKMHRAWWLGPVVGIAGHTVGIVVSSQ